MLSVDEAKLKGWRRAERLEALRQRRQQLFREELERHQVTVEDDCGRDVSSFQAQLGKPLTAEQFIKKLKKCNSQLHFIKNPQFPLYGIYIRDEVNGKRWLSPEGQVMKIRHLFGMPSDIVPEFTVIKKQVTKMPNQDLFNGGKLDGNSKAAEALTERVKQLLPGYNDGVQAIEVAYKQLVQEGVIQPWHEWKEQDTIREIDRQGWRTILVRMLHMKLITESDVMRNFKWTPTRDSRKWHEHTK